MLSIRTDRRSEEMCCRMRFSRADSVNGAFLCLTLRLDIVRCCVKA